MPISVGDAVLSTRRSWPACEVMETLARGMVDYASQAPRSTCTAISIPPSSATGRNPRSTFRDRGANDWVYGLKIMVITPRTPQHGEVIYNHARIPQRARGAGLAVNTGPHKVITNMAVMGFESKRMRAESIHRVFLRRRAGEHRLERSSRRMWRRGLPPTSCAFLREVDPNRYHRPLTPI